MAAAARVPAPRRWGGGQSALLHGYGGAFPRPRRCTGHAGRRRPGAGGGCSSARHGITVPASSGPPELGGQTRGTRASVAAVAIPAAVPRIGLLLRALRLVVQIPAAAAGARPQ